MVGGCVALDLHLEVGEAKQTSIELRTVCFCIRRQARKVALQFVLADEKPQFVSVASGNSAFFCIGKQL